MLEPSIEADPVTAPLRVIVLAVAHLVAVAEFPEHAADVPPFAAAVIVIFAEPSNDTPFIVLAVANLTALLAAPPAEELPA